MDVAPHIYDTAYLETVVSADSIFSLWGSHREKIYREITSKSEIDFLDKILPTDVKCRSRGGTGIRPYNLRQQCPGCILLTKLCDNGVLPDNLSICITTGKHKHVCLNVEMVDIFGFSFREYPLNQRISQEISAMIPEHLSNDKFFGSTNWVSNYAVISVFLSEEFKKAKLPWLTNYMWSYGCSSKNFVIDRQCCALPLTTDENIFGFLKQLITALDFLSTFGFINGNPICDKIGVEEVPVSYKYKGVSVKFPYCIVIIPSKNSSITIKKTRYFNGEHSYLHEKTERPFEKLVPFFSSFKGMCVPAKTAVPSLSEVSSCRILGYHLGHRKNIFAHYCLHEGIYLTSSYELYSYLISLLSVKTTFDIFMTHPGWSRLLEGCWNPREYPAIIKDLEQFHDRKVGPDHVEILSFLSKYTLRFDVISYCMMQLVDL